MVSCSDINFIPVSLYCRTWSEMPWPYVFFLSQGLATVAMASFTRALPMSQHLAFPARSGVIRYAVGIHQRDSCARGLLFQEFLRVRQPNRSKRDEQGPGCLILELTSVLQFHHISICKFPLPCQDAFSVTSGDWKALSRKALSCFAPLFFFFFFFNFVLIIIAGKTVLKY